VLRGTPAVPAPDEAASATAAASAASADALVAAELAASVAREAAQVASQAEQVASAANAAASAVVAPVVAVASEPAASAADDSPKKKTEKERKADKADAKADTKVEAKVEAKPEQGSDEAWVNQLPANGYVVQLAAMDTQEEMRSFQRSNPAYAKARILRARHKDTGKRYFILVAGPFETKPQADTFMQSNILFNKGWLRSSKSMKTQFTKS